MATTGIPDFNGIERQIENPLAPGRGAAAASKPVVLSTEDLAALGATNETAPASDTATAGHNGRLQRIAQRITSLITAINSGRDYETVAASQTDQVLGATGATGDYLDGLLCVVTTAATSQVQIQDGAGSAITVLPNNVGAGVGSYPVPLGLVSTAGAWSVTTGAGVSVIAVGEFT